MANKLVNHIIHLKKILFLAIGLFYSFFGISQAFTVSGKVTDISGKVVTEVPIYINKSTFAAFTNSNGFYSFKVPQKGEYTVIAYGLGYKPVSKTVMVSRNTTIDFKIEEEVTQLKEVTIETEKDPFGVKQLKSVEEGGIYEGKKTEVINIEKSISNKATNNARQAYAKIPGLNIWESDAAGLQLDIGGRGLDPRRTTNFNTRQNGYDMSADALGYPESYYTPPLQAVEQIEVVRGAGALQYGTQFGGLINFKMKQGPSDDTLVFKSENSLGNYAFLNTFNSLGGQIGKLNYYTFYQYKKGNGWRDNSEFDSHGAYAGLAYQANEKLLLKLDYSFLYYLTRQAGGLSDAQFEENAQQSNRDRNWFKVNWNLFAFSLKYQVKPKVTLYSKFFGLVASRTSLGLLTNPTNEDNGENRDLLDGKFRNIGNETRLSFNYPFLKKESTLLVGTRIYRGFTNFSQKLGDTDHDADFGSVSISSVSDREDLDNRTISDYDFPNVNLAFFAENIVRLSSSLSLVPGIRYEYINTKARGEGTRFGETTETTVGDTTSKERHILLIGLGTSLKLNDHLEIYSNITSNYRAINFTDIQVTNPSQTVDPNTKDEKGYSIDLGIRKRNYRKIYFDANIFYIKYNNRIGNILDDDLRLRTNIGSAEIYGIESFVDFNILKLFGYKNSPHKLTYFVNSAISRGYYRDIKEKAISGVQSGNRIENLPFYNIKSGVSYRYKPFSCSLQATYISAQFSDADNSTLKNESTNGIQGVIPAYTVFDFSSQYKINDLLSLGFSMNNITDKKYFTRRATGYPGPGILPAQGRTWFVSANITL